MEILNKVSGCQTAPIESFNTFQGGLKKLDKKNLKRLKESIIKKGFTAPLFIWKGNILDGHQRKTALQSLSEDGYIIPDVPYVEIEAENEKDAKEILLTYVSQYADVTNSGLEDFIKEAGLNALELDAFTNLDLGTLIANEAREDDYEPIKVEPRAKLGDIYQLGEHRLMCGSSTDRANVETLMDGKKADMCFTDPPYNVDYTGGMGTHAKNERQGIQNDSMSKEAFLQFLKDVCANINIFTVGGVYICMSSSEIDSLKQAFEQSGGHWQSFVIWVKNTFTLSRADYQHTYEPILYGWANSVTNHYFIQNRDIANVWEDLRQLKTEFDGEYTIISFQGFEVKIKGKVDGEVKRRKQKTDIWRYDKPTKSAEHPTMKPIALCAEAIKNSSEQGGAVLDLFGGSGSTLIACEQLKRKCYMMELDPKYVDVIIDRWEKLTNKKAVKLN